MMGESIADPDAVESSAGSARGLGLLPVETILRSEKTVRAVDAVTPSGIRFAAYEIHMGETSRPPDAVPFATISEGGADGVRIGRNFGTYLHGALESAELLSELLGQPIAATPSKQQNYARLADWFSRHQRGFEEMYL
jgi:adenosylcobyric acid synthase